MSEAVVGILLMMEGVAFVALALFVYVNIE